MAFTPFLGVFAVLFTCTLSAQTPTDTSKSDNKIDEVIVTGQYGENSLKGSVYKVKLIDEKRIQQQGAVNLKDVMNNELNIRISNDPVLGGGLNIQGMNGQSIKIMIDGVPVTGREGGTIDLNQINLNNIARIELVEGPMSVNYGTDALGGVINLITKKTPKDIMSAGANIYLESSIKANVGINVAATYSKWTYQLSGGRNFFTGFNPRNEGRRMMWKPYTQYMGDASATYNYNKGSVRFQLSYFDEKVTDRDSGIITPYYAIGIDHYYLTKRITNAVFWHHNYNPNHTLDIVGSYNYYSRITRTVSKDLVSLQETLVPQPDQQDTTVFHNFMSRGTMAYKKIKHNLSAQTGYEINGEINDGKRIEGGMKSIYDINLFGSVEWHALPRLLVKPGMRIIYNSGYKAPLTPSVNIKWDVSEVMIVRASYGKGFRAPSLKELYLQFTDPNHNVYGNNSLKAELSDNLQLSTAFEWKLREHVFRLEPSTFYNHMINKISLVQMQPVGSSTAVFYKYENVDDYQSTGLNLNAEYRTPRYSFVLGLARNAVNNHLNGYAESNRFYTSNEARFNINFQFPKQKLSFSVFCKYNGKQQIPQINGLTQSMILGYINPYSLVDVTINKQLLKNKLSVSGGVKNVLNLTNVAANMSTGVHSDISSSAMIGMGRLYFMSLQYNVSTKTGS